MNSFLILAASDSDAQQRVTENTVKSATGSRAPAATVADMAWLEGHWTIGQKSGRADPRIGE
jgi:hypothetical protein